MVLLKQRVTSKYLVSESASEILLELFKVPFTKANLSQHLHTNYSHLSADYPNGSVPVIQHKGHIKTVKYRTSNVRIKVLLSCVRVTIVAVGKQ